MAAVSYREGGHRVVANIEQPVAVITDQQNRRGVWVAANYCARTGATADELAGLLDCLGLDATRAHHLPEKGGRRR